MPTPVPQYNPTNPYQMYGQLSKSTGAKPITLAQLPEFVRRPLGSMKTTIYAMRSGLKPGLMQRLKLNRNNPAVFLDALDRSLDQLITDTGTLYGLVAGLYAQVQAATGNRRSSATISDLVRDTLNRAKAYVPRVKKSLSGFIQNLNRYSSAVPQLAGQQAKFLMQQMKLFQQAFQTYLNKAVTQVIKSSQQLSLQQVQPQQVQQTQQIPGQPAGPVPRNPYEMAKSASRRLRLVAALTRTELYDLAARAAELVNGEGYDVARAVQQTVSEWQQRTNRRLPDQDIRRIEQNVSIYGKKTPNPEVRQKMRQFMDERGLGSMDPHEYQTINPDEAKQLSTEYQGLTRQKNPNDPKQQELKKSYDILRLWIRRQYAAMFKGVKVEIWPKDSEPYPNSQAMREDVRRNHHLWVFAGGLQTDAHPYFSPQENLMFRAVHDYVTHASEGYEFGPQGEYNAWLHHARTLPKEAHLALENETVLQNMWTNYGPHMQRNPNTPLKDRPFVDYPPVEPMRNRPKRTDRPMTLK